MCTEQETLFYLNVLWLWCHLLCGLMCWNIFWRSDPRIRDRCWKSQSEEVATSSAYTWSYRCRYRLSWGTVQDRCSRTGSAGSDAVGEPFWYTSFTSCTCRCSQKLQASFGGRGAWTFRLTAYNKQWLLVPHHTSASDSRSFSEMTSSVSSTPSNHENWWRPAKLLDLTGSRTIAYLRQQRVHQLTGPHF